MPLLARTIAAPVAIEIAPGGIERLPGLLADGRISRGDVAVIVGKGLGVEIAARLSGSIKDAPVFTVTGGSMDSAREVVSKMRGSFFDAVVGIGGGGTLDVAKYAASMLGLPFVAVATSLAHDGLASPVAVLENNGHKGSFGVHLPIAVVVDLDYVARAPAALTRSGLGDALSNLSALADWELASRERGEVVDGLAAAMARTASEALLYRDDPIDSSTFLRALAEGLVFGGMSMVVAGSSRPCSGACHEISHAIDSLFPSTANHGEQVAVGALFASWLRDDPQLGALDACLARYGLPRVPADLALSAEQFTAAVRKAPETRPDRYTILEHLAMDDDEARRRVDAFIKTFSR